MTYLHIRLSCFLLLMALTSASAQRLVLMAPAGSARLPEVVEIPLAEARRHIADIEHTVAINAQTHEALETQIDEDKLLIAVQVPASGRLMIALVHGEPAAQPAQVFGREAPERKDDFAWENQLVTYRVYGPALEATGEITSGIDVWSKRVPNLVIDSFYKRDAEGQRLHDPSMSYHKDNGVGLDSYEVGKSRGCGGTGVLADGKLWVSNNYTHLRPLANGPVRFAFELTYAPWKAGGVEVTETKRITLDAGTHMNRIDATFTFSGAAMLNAVAGLALHRDAQLETLAEDSVLSDWDTPQDGTAGKMATGLVALPGQHAVVQTIDDGHWKQALLVFPIRSGQTFTYYAGSGWSKADMPTQQAWDAYLMQTQEQLQHPLVHRWEGK